MTLVASGPMTLAAINTEFGLGTNLSQYQNYIWWKDDGSTGRFSGGAISLSEFYAKRRNSPSTAGSTAYYTAGTYSFTVPTYTTLTVQVAGAGGGGGGVWYSGAGAGGPGGASAFGGVTGGGGGGGSPANSFSGIYLGANGGNGTASGGTYNVNGGGAAGANGAATNSVDVNFTQGGKGGDGAYSSQIFTLGQLTPGQVITITVGAGGAGGGGGGGPYLGDAAVNGYVAVSWT